VGQVRRITDVVARMQQNGSASRAHVCAASAQHHVLDRARGVGLRKTRLAGLHLQSVYIALRAGRAVGQQGRSVVGGFGVGRYALVGADHAQMLLGLFEKLRHLQAHGYGQRPQGLDAGVADTRFEL